MKKNIQLSFIAGLISTGILLSSQSSKAMDPVRARCTNGYTEMLELHGENVNASKVADHCGPTGDKSCFNSKEPTLDSVIELLAESNCVLKHYSGDIKKQSQCEFACDRNIGVFKSKEDNKDSDVLIAVIQSTISEKFKYFIFNMYPGNPDK